jgi:hypothetical protein
MEDINQKLKKLIDFNKYEFKIINKEVNVIENSTVNSYDFDLNVMLGKKYGVYSLFEGSNNHYAIFDFQKKLFLKDILISVKQNFGCVLKNFKVSIKNEDDEWEEVNSFICQDNNYKDEIQSFQIEKETQLLKIDFIDAWSNEGGNYILIKKLSFRVADII